MKESSDRKKQYHLPPRMIIAMLVISSIVAFANSAFVDKSNVTGKEGKLADLRTDSIESVKAFTEVYKVLMHPRCMNCHPKGDVPLQGDDSHLHTMAPKRGKDGHGFML